MAPQAVLGRMHPRLGASAQHSVTRRLARASGGVPVLPARSRASRLAVLAFRDNNGGSSVKNFGAAEHVALPVNYYRLLQVDSGCRPDAVRSSYEQLIRRSPLTSYSNDTMFARAVLLKAASESLTDPELRRSYDAKLAAGHTTLRVSQQDLPGALVVLQEIGEYQTTLDLASRWLELNAAQPDAADVAAALALAHCDRASERLHAAPADTPHLSPMPDGSVPTEHGPNIRAACEDLEAALATLRRYKIADQLQTQIKTALRDLAPENACELLSLPLSAEHATKRARGVALYRGLLRAAAAAADGAPEPEAESGAPAGEGAAAVVAKAQKMLHKGRGLLTAEEQVVVLPDALRCSGPVPAPEVVYDGAMALIAQGFSTGCPHLVHQADQLLVRLENQVDVEIARVQCSSEDPDLAYAREQRRAAYGIGEHGHHHGHHHHEEEHAEAEQPPWASGVALERAMCRVLLGDYDGAARMLGLAPAEAGTGRRGAAAAPDPQLLHFVTEHSPSGGNDLRPGLRALAARWLEGVALAGFRDTAGRTVAEQDVRSSWFGSLRVGTYQMVWRLFRGSPAILAMAHLITNLLPNLMAALARTAAAVAGAFTAVAASKAATTAAPQAAPAPGRAAAGGRSTPDMAALQEQSRERRAAANRAQGRIGPEAQELLAEQEAAAAYGGAHMPPAAAASSSTAVSARTAGSYAARSRSTSADLDAQPASAAGAAAGASTWAARPAAQSAAASAYAATAGGAMAPEAPQQAARGPAGAHPASHAPHAEELDAHHEGEEEGGRALSERELRAHLAGLEAAMWDSEPPKKKVDLQQLAVWGLGAVAVVVAFLSAGVRRPAMAAEVHSAQSAAATTHQPPPPMRGSRR